MNFTFAVLPDTQYEVARYPAMWQQMCDWIVANRVSMNIQAAISVGDVVDLGDLYDIPAQDQFDEALLGWNKFSEMVCLPCMGNHYYDNIPNRTATAWNANFGAAWWTGKSYFGGHYSTGYENTYVTLETEGIKFLIINLEFFPRDAVLTWADDIIAANMDCQVIITTHGYMNNDGKLTATLDTYGPHGYGLDADNSGEQLWDKFISKHENIILVLCGHYIHTAAHRTDHNIFGKRVHGIFTDYQDVGGDGGGCGNGYICLLNFNLDTHKINVTTYSPFLSDFDADKGEYDLDYNFLPVGDNCAMNISDSWPCTNALLGNAIGVE